MKRSRFTFSTMLLAVVCATALFIWSLLVFNTVGLAQQAMTLPTSTTTPAPTGTLLPTATLQPTVAWPTPSAAPLADTAPRDQPAVLHPKTGRYIAAWLPDTFNSENRQSFEANADILDEISPFWYAPDIYGNIYHGGEARDQALLDLARSKGVLVIPTIHNVVNGNDPVRPLLSSPERRSRHVQIIVDEVLNRGYDGIDIDYEGLPPSYREEFTAFITELGAALRAQGKLLTIAVHGKTSDYGGLGGFQDWVALGQVVDRLRIMTYDYSWRGSEPGPVAPVYWVEQVAEYAKTVVDPAKVVIGVPFYGYDWPANGPAVARLWSSINEQIQRDGLSLNLMESNANGLVQENWLVYNASSGRRTVWFATKSSLEAKIALVQKYDLAGIAIWRLGGEDPGKWNVIRNRLVEDPFESQRMINQMLPNH
jgi:spore germination protein YaaH